MRTIRKNILIASTAPGNTEPGILPLPQLRAMAVAPVDHSFFEAKGFPQSSLDNYGDLEPTLFSHPFSTRFPGVIKSYASSVSQIFNINARNLAYTTMMW